MHGSTGRGRITAANSREGFVGEPEAGLFIRVLDQFTRWQSMNWDDAGKPQKAQMDVADLAFERDYVL